MQSSGGSDKRDVLDEASAKARLDKAVSDVQKEINKIRESEARLAGQSAFDQKNTSLTDNMRLVDIVSSAWSAHKKSDFYRNKVGGLRHFEKLITVAAAAESILNLVMPKVTREVQYLGLAEKIRKATETGKNEADVDNICREIIHSLQEHLSDKTLCVFYL